MLYYFSFVQIFIYLFAIPAIRLIFYQVEIDYAWAISFTFMTSFLTAGFLFSFLEKNNIRASNELLRFHFSKVGLFFVFTWVTICIVISLQYELYNRRIGTENAAELFASIPIIILLLFRSLELALPMLIALIVIKIADGMRLVRSEIYITMLLLAAFLSLGAASSRSATGLFLILVLVICQNRIPKYLFRKVILYFLLFGGVFFLGVTVVRSIDNVERNFDEYLSAEIVQRIDGLEVVSEVVSIYGYQLFGVNPSAALNPIIAAIPFLDESVQLKADALTTVKAVILEHDLGSKLRDINSFVVLDVYYLGGFFGIVIAGLAIGFLARWVDLHIGRRVGIVIFVSMVSIASNILILEREALGMIISVLRDFFILYIIFNLVFFHDKNHKLN